MALKKILYVEDDECIAKVTIMTLEELGQFEVHHCYDGKTAISEFSSFQPDLVLLDVMMPGMDGIEVFKKLKELKEDVDLSVIFMTAKIQKQEQKLYLDMGAMGIVLKPYDPLVLCDQLNNIWEKNDAK